MEKTSFFGAILVMLFAVDAYAAAAAHVYSSRLIHRFSEEVRRGGGGEGEAAAWPEGKRVEHMRVLLESDLKRQRLKLGTQNQVFVGSQGGETFNYGNDMGWYVLFFFLLSFTF